MVDEYTKKPYGPGLGEWKKELMLLSRDLDPSVANINRHPPGAVARIAEWIQHTWEYSEPIRFECVKEVVARGVALRRSDLWKKIRNNEPKPDGMSDRVWRTLEKQLHSLATMTKIENCSRANASRMNFGRTGPSGEVGVRQRLRKWLRRSPNPEEISFEMARDKGYGGRSRINKENMDIMHGSTALALVPKESMGMKRQSSNLKNAKSPPTKRHEHENDEVEEDEEGRNPHEVVGGGVLALSEEQILQHPLVMKMMQRLEALEGQLNASTLDQQKASFHVSQSSGRLEVIEHMLSTSTW